jgi:hypothetical protein
LLLWFLRLLYVGGVASGSRNEVEVKAKSCKCAPAETGRAREGTGAMKEQLATVSGNVELARASRCGMLQ